MGLRKRCDDFHVLDVVSYVVPVISRFVRFSYPNAVARSRGRADSDDAVDQHSSEYRERCGLSQVTIHLNSVTEFSLRTTSMSGNKVKRWILDGFLLVRLITSSEPTKELILKHLLDYVLIESSTTSSGTFIR